MGNSMMLHSSIYHVYGVEKVYGNSLGALSRPERCKYAIQERVMHENFAMNKQLHILAYKGYRRVNFMDQNEIYAVNEIAE